MALWKKKELCVVCNKIKTRKKDKSEKPVCAECQLKNKLASEKKIRCPHDGSEMEKEIIENSDLIIDRCSQCHGIWLDDDELELVIVIKK